MSDPASQRLFDLQVQIEELHRELADVTSLLRSSVAKLSIVCKATPGDELDAQRPGAVALVNHVNRALR